jgi:hypothetical protein
MIPNVLQLCHVPQSVALNQHFGKSAPLFCSGFVDENDGRGSHTSNTTTDPMWTSNMLATCFGCQHM